MRLVWLGICTMGVIGCALLWAKEAENQTATGHFSEYKYQTSHPAFPNKPASGEPFSENKVQKSGQHENPLEIKQQDQQKNTTPVAQPNAAPTTPAPPMATPAQVNIALQQAYPNMGNWFNADWWASHGANPNFNPAANWWAGANWAGASGWAGASAANPLFYDPNGTTSVATVPTSNTNTETTKTKAVDNWMPLGVFAVGTDKTDPTDATAFLQLAVNNQGLVSGTYYDPVTDKTQQIEGTYDKATQEVTWEIKGMPDSPSCKQACTT